MPRELVEIGTCGVPGERGRRLTDMRGDERTQDGMFSYVWLEQRVPADHPLRAVRKLTDAVLGTLSPEFDALCAASGRPSIAPCVWQVFLGSSAHLVKSHSNFAGVLW